MGTTDETLSSGRVTLTLRHRPRTLHIYLEFHCSCSDNRSRLTAAGTIQ